MPETLIQDLHSVQLYIRPASLDGSVEPGDHDYPLVFAAHNNQILIDPDRHNVGAIQAPVSVTPGSTQWEEMSWILDRFTEFQAKS
jgi:hypothetical protein